MDGEASGGRPPSRAIMAPEPSFVSLGDDEFLRAAKAIVDTARTQGTVLRILGSVAIYAHSTDPPESLSVFRLVGRLGPGTPLFTDLDLMGYARQGRAISTVLEGLGFRPDSVVNGFFGDRRLIYYEPSDKFHVDIF